MAVLPIAIFTSLSFLPVFFLFLPSFLAPPSLPPSLPKSLQEMLVRLYNEGPETRGIFRITANTRKVKEMKEAINNSEWSLNNTTALYR